MVMEDSEIGREIMKIESNSKKRKAEDDGDSSVKMKTSTTEEGTDSSVKAKTDSDENTDSSVKTSSSEDWEEEVYEFRVEEEHEKLYNHSGDVKVIYYPPIVLKYDDLVTPLTMFSTSAIREYNCNMDKSYSFLRVERAFFHTPRSEYEITFSAILPDDENAQLFHARTQFVRVLDVKRCTSTSFTLTTSMVDNEEEIITIKEKVQEEEKKANDWLKSVMVEKEVEEEEEEFPLPSQEDYRESLEDAFFNYHIIYDPPVVDDYDEYHHRIAKLSRVALKKFNRRTGKSYKFLRMLRGFKLQNKLYDLTFSARLPGKVTEYFHARAKDYRDTIDICRVNYSKLMSSMPQGATEPSEDDDVDVDLTDEEMDAAEAEGFTREGYAEELDLTNFYRLERCCGWSEPFRVLYDPPKRTKYNPATSPLTIYSMVGIREYSLINGTRFTFVSLKQAYVRPVGSQYYYGLTLEAALPDKDDAELFRAWIMVERGKEGVLVEAVKPVRAKTFALSN